MFTFVFLIITDCKYFQAIEGSPSDLLAGGEGVWMLMDLLFCCIVIAHFI